MTTVQIPDDLAARAKELARRENRTLDQLVAAAVSSQISSDEQLSVIRARAERADLAEFDRILARVPAAPPVPGDEK